MEDLTLRLVERLLISLGGILSIYLGYRLFYISQLPADGNGTLKLRDVVDISLSRIGPGVFFALFGAFVLYTSITQQVTIEAVAPRQTPVVVGTNPFVPGTYYPFFAPTRNNERIKQIVSELPADQQEKILKKINDYLNEEYSGGGYIKKYVGETPPGLIEKFKLNTDKRS